MATNEDMLRRLEDAVDIMTDMSTIKRSQHTKENEEKIELSPALVKEAIEAYNLFDRDNQGIDIQELATVFRAVGQNPTDAELRVIMKKNDLNCSGRLTQEEFELMITSYMKPMWQVQQELKDAFRIFDRDGNGTIDTAELEIVLKKFGEPLTHRQSKELIELMDKNGDGQVDMDDFVKFLCEVDQPDYFKKHYPDKRRGQSNVSKDKKSVNIDAAGRVDERNATNGHANEIVTGDGCDDDQTVVKEGQVDDQIVTKGPDQTVTSGHVDTLVTKGHDDKLLTKGNDQIVTKEHIEQIETKKHDDQIETES